MNLLAANPILRRWRDVGRWLLFIALALGFAKAPLAYGCPPQLDHAGHPTNHAGNTDNPCHHPLNHRLLPGDQDRECCLLHIDNGLRGGESTLAISPSPDRPAPDLPPAIAGTPDFPLPGRPTGPAVPQPAETFRTSKHPPYLLTLRLRL